MRQLVPFFNLVDSTTKTPWVAFQSFFLHMGVSKNSGTPKSWILIGFSIIFTIHFGGFPQFFGNTHMYSPVFFFGRRLQPVSCRPFHVSNFYGPGGSDVECIDENSNGLSLELGRSWTWEVSCQTRKLKPAKGCIYIYIPGGGLK